MTDFTFTENFIVERPDSYLFIEFKDPQDPKARNNLIDHLR